MSEFGDSLTIHLLGTTVTNNSWEPAISVSYPTRCLPFTAYEAPEMTRLAASDFHLRLAYITALPFFNGM